MRPLKPYYKKEFIESFNSLYYSRFMDESTYKSYNGRP